MNYNKLEEIRKVRKLSRQEMVDVVDISISTYKQNLSKKNNKPNLIIFLKEHITLFAKILKNPNLVLIIYGEKYEKSYLFNWNGGI